VKLVKVVQETEHGLGRVGELSQGGVVLRDREAENDAGGPDQCSQAARPSLHIVESRSGWWGAAVAEVRWLDMSLFSYF